MAPVDSSILQRIEGILHRDVVMENIALVHLENSFENVNVPAEHVQTGLAHIMHQRKDGVETGGLKTSAKRFKMSVLQKILGDAICVVVAPLAYIAARVHASPLDFAAVGPVVLDGSV